LRRSKKAREEGNQMKTSSFILFLSIATIVMSSCNSYPWDPTYTCTCELENDNVIVAIQLEGMSEAEAQFNCSANEDAYTSPATCELTRNN